MGEISAAMSNTNQPHISAQDLLLFNKSGYSTITVSLKLGGNALTAKLMHHSPKATLRYTERSVDVAKSDVCKLSAVPPMEYIVNLPSSNSYADSVAVPVLST